MPQLFQDPEYQKLAPEDKRKVLQGLFDKQVASDKSFASLKPEEQEQVRAGVFQKWDPTYQETAAAPKEGFISRLKSEGLNVIPNLVTGGLQSAIKGAMAFAPAVNIMTGSILPGQRLQDTADYKVMEEATKPKTAGQELGGMVEQGAEMLLGEGLVKQGVRQIPKLAGKAGKMLAESVTAGGVTAAHDAEITDVVAASAMSPALSLATAASLGAGRAMLNKIATGHGWAWNKVKDWIKGTAGRELSIARSTEALDEIYKRNPFFATLSGFVKQVKGVKQSVDGEVDDIIVKATNGGAKVNLTDPILMVEETIPNTTTKVQLLPNLKDIIPANKQVSLIQALEVWRAQNGPMEFKIAGFTPEQKKMVRDSVEEWYLTLRGTPDVAGTTWAFPLNLQRFKQSLGASTTFNGAYIKDDAQRLLNQVKIRLYHGINDYLDRLDPSLRHLNNVSSGIYEILEHFGGRGARGAAFPQPSRILQALIKGTGLGYMAPGAFATTGPLGAAAMTTLASTPVRAARMQLQRGAGKVLPYGRIPAQVMAGNDPADIMK